MGYVTSKSNTRARPPPQQMVKIVIIVIPQHIVCLDQFAPGYQPTNAHGFHIHVNLCVAITIVTNPRSFLSSPLAVVVVINCLRLTEVRIPNHTVRHTNAHLECHYDLDGEVLYSVKWYKDGNEFYRYVPRDMPPVLIFNQTGVTVDVSNCSRLNSDPCQRHPLRLSAVLLHWTATAFSYTHLPKSSLIHHSWTVPSRCLIRPNPPLSSSTTLRMPWSC